MAYIQIYVSNTPDLGSDPDSTNERMYFYYDNNPAVPAANAISVRLRLSQDNYTEEYPLFSTDGDIVPTDLMNLGVGEYLGTKECLNGTTTLRRFQILAAWPWLQIVDTPDAAECVVGFCDITIDTPIIATNASSSTASDGSANITITSEKFTSSQLEYSTNGGGSWVNLPNGSLSLTMLAPGTYTIIVRDKNDTDCFDSEDFTVDADIVDTYQVKYQNSFTNHVGISYTSQILERGYTGAVIPVCLAESKPLRLTGGKRGETETKPIFGSSCELTLLSETNFQFNELFDADDRKFMMRVLKNGSLLWQGWVLQDYSEPYVRTKNYPVRVTAEDGLGRLKYFDFVSDSGQQFIGRKTQLQILKICLDKIELDARIFSHVNVYAEGQGKSTGAEPMQQTYLDMEIFAEMNCYEVVEEILRPYFARIQQVEGNWHIYRIPEYYSDDIVRRAYLNNANGSFDYDIIVNLNKSITKPTGDKTNEIFWRDGSQRMENRHPWGKARVVFDNGLNHNFVKNPDFEDTTTEGGPLLNFGGTATYKRIRKEDGSYAVYLAGIVNNFMNADNFVTDPIPINTNVLHQWKLSFSWQVVTNYIVDNAENLDFYFQVQNGGKYLQDDGTWTSSETQIVIHPGSANSEEQFELVITPFEDATPIRITFFQLVAPSIDSGSGVEISDLAFEFLPFGNYLEDETIFEQNNPSFTSFGEEEIDVMWGDADDAENIEFATKLFRNSSTLINGTATTYWARRDVNESKPILQIYVESLIRQMGIPRIKLTGALSGDFFWHNAIIETNSHGYEGSKFIVLSDDFDLRENSHNVEMVELVSPTTSNARFRNYVADVLLQTDGEPLLMTDGKYILLDIIPDDFIDTTPPSDGSVGSTVPFVVPSELGV